MPISPLPLTADVARLRTTVAHDVDEHARNLTNWEQRYDQVAAGRFNGMLKEWQADGLQIFREHTSHAVRQSCCVWPDAYWFGIEPGVSDMRINGRQVGSAQIITRPGNREFELMTPDSHAILGIVIQRNTFLEAGARYACRIDWKQLSTAELLQVTPAALQTCVRQIGFLLDSDTFADGEQRQEQVIMTLLAMLDRSEIDNAVCTTLSRRRGIVNDARDFAMQHQTQAITVPMLCKQLHVSRRTLQYCFEDVLGLSPMTYLRSLRLNGVRRQLQAGVPTDQRIGDVAAAWGFTNFSQFSCDYKKLFGISPSAMLRTAC